MNQLDDIPNQAGLYLVEPPFLCTVHIKGWLIYLIHQFYRGRFNILVAYRTQALNTTNGACLVQVVMFPFQTFDRSRNIEVPILNVVQLEPITLWTDNDYEYANLNMFVLGVLYDWLVKDNCSL